MTIAFERKNLCGGWSIFIVRGVERVAAGQTGFEGGSGDQDGAVCALGEHLQSILAVGAQGLHRSAGRGGELCVECLERSVAAAGEVIVPLQHISDAAVWNMHRIMDWKEGLAKGGGDTDTTNNTDRVVQQQLVLNYCF
eukprot:CAMPEP_0171301086 /NCGR_PEP_ID=MMETSP0816-20121228/10143_1 /TAXON_ID=420281 /ORGANISM="Proboscia inermis, Strain CCAP1064/1" /LENGTH=138 /DNA_ID=CAMNT_0011778291 /DNA_START=258 /DNA_END=672 /DNA_ORIENTATION=-